MAASFAYGSEAMQDFTWWARLGEKHIHPDDIPFVKHCIAIPLSSGASVYRSRSENRTSMELKLLDAADLWAFETLVGSGLLG